jgi:hypothetical protein
VRVVIFDDVLHARGERYQVGGLEVPVYPHADDAVALADGADLVCMDFSMGSTHLSGAEAIQALRDAGFEKRIVGISSDGGSNREMLDAGADEAIPKMLLRTFLGKLG